MMIKRPVAGSHARDQQQSVNFYPPPLRCTSSDLIEYGDDIELIFIELPKFNLDEQQLQTAKDRWLYFVKNAGSLHLIPDSLAKQPHIQHAFGIANEAGMSQEELDAQDKRHDFIRLQRGSIEKALQDGLLQGREEGLEEGLEKGREEGLKQGIEQGEQRKALQIAASLLALLDDATIAANTGLSEAQVAQLRLYPPSTAD